MIVLLIDSKYNLLILLVIVDMLMCIASLDSHYHYIDIIGVFRFLFILGALEAQLMDTWLRE